VVGHSYGTFVCSHLLRLHRPLVQSMARARMPFKMSP